jgi:hypothetical protein
LAPPMPELHKATRDWPEAARAGSAVRSVGTRRRYSSHLMRGFGLEKFTFGGMMPVRKVLTTLVRDAKNAAISV